MNWLWWCAWTSTRTGRRCYAIVACPEGTPPAPIGVPGSFVHGQLDALCDKTGPIWRSWRDDPQAEKAVPPAPRRGTSPAPTPPRTPPPPEPWEVFCTDCDDVVVRAQDLPPRAADFVDGILEKLTDMREWAVEHAHVTEKMQTALDNIEAGVARWEH